MENFWWAFWDDDCWGRDQNLRFLRISDQDISLFKNVCINMSMSDRLVCLLRNLVVCISWGLYELLNIYIRSNDEHNTYRLPICATEWLGFGYLHFTYHVHNRNSKVNGFFSTTSLLVDLWINHCLSHGQTFWSEWY